MKKFWKWMEKNKHGYWDHGNVSLCIITSGGVNDVTEGEIPKQMLIGYKIEFLINEGVDIEDICQYRESIEILNDYLDKKIKE
jgi:hypothetical protein